MRLPPLNALRAFEAAARHESFARAATELHVSEGAVSRHVKLLEEHLGVALFRRRPRGVALTDPGRRLLPEVTGSFQRIAEAATRVTAADGAMKVMAPVTLGGRWLVPRLPRFRAAHPEVNISVGVYEREWEAFFEGGYDVGICCYQAQLKRPADVAVSKVMDEALTPVCSPTLLENTRTLELSDLPGQVLLHTYSDHADWRKWLELAGLSDVVDHRRGMTFDTMEMAVQAARGGLGIAIADLRFFENELRSGELVAPFDLVLSDQTGYFLFCQQDRNDERGITVFREWLLSEAGQFGSTKDGLTHEGKPL